MKTNLFLLLMTTAVLCSSNAFSQTDSAYFDLGSYTIKKEFAHHVTIKGEELERMPFHSLQDALNVYLVGSYTNSASGIGWKD